MIKCINDWRLEIEDELVEKVEQEYKERLIFPKKENLFAVFNLIKQQDVNVIILGQDPYPTEGDANGIAFSVNRKEKIPASLRNIFKELNQDLGIKRVDGDLSGIVKQGVLLLNTVLTVESKSPQSHRTLGWQKTTDKVIEDLSRDGQKVFVLLGKNAQEYINKIDESKNVIVVAPHPSPLSAYRGFFGSKIFSKINKALLEYNKKEIDWTK